MRKLCIGVGIVVFSSLGWWLGDRWGVMAAFLLSSVGSWLGVYLGWRIHRDYLG